MTYVSVHLTFNREKITNFRSVAPNTFVTFVNGHQSEALGQGDVEPQAETAENGTSRVLPMNVIIY